MKKRVLYFFEGYKEDVESIVDMMQGFVRNDSVAFIKDEYVAESNKGVFVVVFDDIPTDVSFPTYEVINSMCKWKGLRFLSDVVVK